MTEAGFPFWALDAVAVAFFPAYATDLSWWVADARAVELSPAAVAFAVLSFEAADPAVEFAPVASDVAVEFVAAAEAAFDDDPEAVEVAFEVSTAVDDACPPSPAADAVAVESFAPELAADPVGLPVLEVAVLRPLAAAEAGPPVALAVEGVVGFSSVPPPAEAPPELGPPSNVPALLALAPPAPKELELAPAAAPASPPLPPSAGSGSSVGRAVAAELLVLVAARPVAVPGVVEVDAVADGGSAVAFAEAPADASARAGVVPVAGVYVAAAALEAPGPPVVAESVADPEAALPDVVRLDPADGPPAPVPRASACVPSLAVQTARPSAAVQVSPMATNGSPAVVAAASTRALNPIAVRVRTGFQAAILRTPP